MNKRLKFSLLVVLLAGVGFYLHSQQITTTQAPVSTQQTASHADAATVNQTSNTSAATITFNAQSGLYFYLTSIDIENCAGASAVTAANPTAVTTTNLTGSPQWMIGSGTTAGACQPTINVTWPTGLKSAAPGTNTTLVLPTFATNQTVRVNAYGFYAP